METTNRRRFCAAIAEHDTDGSLFCSILEADTEEELLQMINRHFSEEESEEHRVDGFPLRRLADADGLDRYDEYTDRHYRVTLSVPAPVPDGRTELLVRTDERYLCDSLRDLANYIEECDGRETAEFLRHGCRGDHYTCDIIK